MVGKLNGLTPSIAPQPVLSSKPPPPVPPLEDATAEPASSVRLSGHAMMLSRLFRTTEPSAEPAVAQAMKQGADTDVYPYLQKEDRALLAEAYDFATEKGIDPSNVDAVARDIAVHRQSSPSLEILDDTGGEPSVGDEKKVELARAVTAYRTTPGSPADRARFANATSRILQDHLSSGGKVDFEFVRRLLTQPAEGSRE